VKVTRSFRRAAFERSLAVTLLLHHWQPFAGNTSVVFAKTAITTTLVTTFIWIAVTLLTQPESDAVLLAFYRKVRPDVRGWKRVAALAPEQPPTRDLGPNLYAWLLGCVMVYLSLFGVGKLLLHEWLTGTMLLLGSAVSAVLLYREISMRWSKEAEQRPQAAHQSSSVLASK
jgi:hypothetical protein